MIFQILQNCQKFENFKLTQRICFIFKMPNEDAKCATHTHTHTQVIIEFPWGQPLDVF
jgi:hypothetical protein